MTMDNLPDITTCPNCGYRYTGNYCPNCGQSTRELNRPFGEMFKDLMDTLFEFDTRFVRSIKPLLLKPGFLPAEYVAGRRATYYPPFKLFIFISIFLFALLEISSTDMISAGILNVNETSSDSSRVDSLNYVGIIPDSSYVPKVVDTAVIQVGNDTIYYKYVMEGDTTDTREEIIESLKALRDSLPPEKWLRKRLVNGIATLFENPEYSWNVFLKRISQSLFLLLPIFALLLKLFYIRSRRFYIQHFVFSIYFHCFAFLIILFVLLVSMFFEGIVQTIAGFLILLIPIYLFVGMKRFYRQSVVKTTAKFLMLSGFYTITLLFGILGIIVLTLVLI